MERSTILYSHWARQFAYSTGQYFNGQILGVYWFDLAEWSILFVRVKFLNDGLYYPRNQWGQFFNVSKQAENCE